MAGLRGTSQRRRCMRHFGSGTGGRVCMLMLGDTDTEGAWSVG